MAFFLAGGMISSVSIGLAIVFVLQGSSRFFAGSSPPVDPIVYFGAGVLTLVLAGIVRRRPPAHDAADDAGAGTGRVSRLLARSDHAPIAFVAGLALNVVPGVWYLVALKDITESGYSKAEVVAVIVAFCVIQYALIEIPLLGFAFAPTRTTDLSRRFSGWLSANTRTVAVGVLVAVAIYMFIRGVISLLL